MLDTFDDRLDPTFAPDDRARLISGLRAILPARGLITEAEGMRVYVLLPDLDELLGVPGFGLRNPILVRKTRAKGLNLPGLH